MGLLTSFQNKPTQQTIDTTLIPKFQQACYRAIGAENAYLIKAVQQFTQDVKHMSPGQQQNMADLLETNTGYILNCYGIK